MLKVLVVALLQGAPPPVGAPADEFNTPTVPPQDVPPDPPVPVPTGPPPRFSEDADVTVGEAIEAGYAPRPKDQPAGSLSAGLAAIFPGVLIHGFGHWLVDDNETALKLLLTEVLAVGLIAAGLVGDASTNHSGQYAGTFSVLQHYGWALFIGSWLADVVGAFKGAEPFHRTSYRMDGRRLRLAYRYTRDPRTDFRHHLLGGLDLDWGWVYLRPEVDLEVALDTRRYQLELAGRVLRGDNPQNHLAVGTRLRRVETPAFGISNIGAMGFVEARGDLGVFIRSLRGFYLFNRLGYGWEGTQIASREGDIRALTAPTDFSETYLVLESGLAVNSGPRTNIAVAFIVDETLDLAPITPRGFVIDAALTHRYQDDLDIEFHFTAGDAFAVWLGLEYGL